MYYWALLLYYVIFMCIGLVTIFSRYPKISGPIFWECVALALDKCISFHKLCQHLKRGLCLLLSQINLVLHTHSLCALWTALVSLQPAVAWHNHLACSTPLSKLHTDVCDALPHKDKRTRGNVMQITYENISTIVTLSLYQLLLLLEREGWA